MPKPRRPHVASADQVRIIREGDYAHFEYADPRVASVRVQIGADKLGMMNDSELLAFWNERVAATDEFIRTQTFTLTEIPPGKPQVEYFEAGGQWVPRGHVLRAVILNDSAVEPDLDEPFVSIDDRDFTLREFHSMVGTFGGWGMRIAFVSDEDLHERPRIKVREPKEPPAAKPGRRRPKSRAR